MEQHDIKLTQKEFALLNKGNRLRNNVSTRDRAIEIAKIFLKKKAGITIHAKPKAVGADLSYTLKNDVVNIEVKGTDSEDIAWGKLKVSGNASCEGINDNWPVYRVTRVFEQTPSIFILKHGVDFTLKSEPRWRFIRCSQ